MKKKSLAVLIIGSALIWSFVIVGCALKLRGTDGYDRISYILIGGFISNFILIWLPLILQNKKAKNTAKIVILLSLIYNTALAQEAPLHEKSLLWEISGNGLSEASYLFGTIHIMDSAYFFLDNEVVETFNKCDRIVFEIDTDQPGFEKKSLAITFMQNDSLDNILSEEEYREISDFFLKEFNFPLQAVKKMKPFYVANLIDALSLPAGSKGYEEAFKKMAGDQGIEIAGISTIGKEAELLDGISMSDQVKSLFKGMEEYYGGFERKLKVLNAFQEQDIDRIFKLMKSAMDDYDTVYQSMFPDRHAIWIPNMKALMQNHSCFFAVGVGHLAGQEGVINLLKKEGYRLKAIMN